MFFPKAASRARSTAVHEEDMWLRGNGAGVGSVGAGVELLERVFAVVAVDRRGAVGAAGAGAAAARAAFAAVLLVTFALGEEVWAVAADRSLATAPLVLMPEV